MRFGELFFAYICDIYGFDFEKGFQKSIELFVMILLKYINWINVYSCLM